MGSETKVESPVGKTKFKIIVLGEANVGKTCLTYRFCDNNFPKSVCATVGFDFREKTVKVYGRDVKLNIWDTAGQDRFRKGVTAHFFRNADAVMFVFDVTSNSSLLNLRHWIDECVEHDINPDTKPCVIVGNKCDDRANRAVSTNSAIMFADAHRMPFFETSAKDEEEYSTINSIFETLAYKLVNEKRSGGNSDTNSFKVGDKSREKEKEKESSCC